MSASLVGSEMCIRDSSFPALPRALSPPCRLATRSFPALPRALSPPCRACLLYTSDAADDM
eukprot:13046563-Alexandrium_andersonii.AAC.1